MEDSNDTDTNIAEDVLMGDSTENELLSNDDAVSLFNNSLKKALQQQNEAIVSSIVKQVNFGNRKNLGNEHGENAQEASKFEFKHEGHRIQHSFNTKRLEKLSEVKNFVKVNDLEKAEQTIEKEITELRQRNKILKIADRHGWDTVNEYLDDPLADNNEDAVKLRGAVYRAARKRNYRGKPHGFSGQNRQGTFSANDFFRGFSQMFAPGLFKRTNKSDDNTGQQAFDRKCFLCRQSGHYVRDCPLARGQPVTGPNSTVASTSGTKQ